MAVPVRRVLVVDDNPDIRHLIRVNLELEGYAVVEAIDGQDCLEQVYEVRPDLITLDVVMPNLDGIETARRLKSDPRTRAIPIVMVTANAQESDLELGSRLGVQAYLTKPFVPEELVETIRSLTEWTSTTRRSDGTNRPAGAV